MNRIKIHTFKKYISPYFFTRYKIAKAIKELDDLYKFQGNLLDIGCGNKPYKSYFKSLASYEGIDFKDFSQNRDYNQSQPDYNFDSEYIKTFKLPFKQNSFNNTAAFQTLEHHRNVEIMFNEIARVTKNNGYIILTFPFIEGLHEEPHDYQRLTEYRIADLAEKNSLKILKTIKIGSIFSTQIMLMSRYIDVIAGKSKTIYIMMAVIFLIFILPLQYIAIVIDRIFKSDKIFINYVFLMQKEPT